MHGEFIGVWSETWREIWSPLIALEGVPEDVFCELYRELAPALKVDPSFGELADIIDDHRQSREAFERTRGEDISGEWPLAKFLEATLSILDDLGGEALSNSYFNLLDRFIAKFSLRYDLRRPCILCPTLTGMFASLIRDLRNLTNHDAHLDSLMKDFENTVRDLRTDRSDSRIKTCIQKQVNLLEAIGGSCANVTATELGAICSQLTTWPHAALKASLKSVYGFTSDYPGIRHGGHAKSAIRTIEMRDMVAVSILLAGFTPYLTDQLNADFVYGGG